MFKFIVLFLIFFNSLYAQIINYTPIFEPFLDGNKQYVYIRKFEQDGKIKALLVNANSLQTDIVLYAQKPKIDISQTSYYKLLKIFKESPFELLAYGLKHTNSSGVAITIDMCQSKKPFEKALFENLKDKPVAICMSGKWAQNHKEEFVWLASNMKNATWVNHSMTHPYNKNMPYEQNFLLSNGVNFDSEVLELEKLLIQNKLVPSIFFRFPGLVSNEATIKRLNEFGLIPLSTDAWLAKKEKPKSGSIILIHGNGNEPDGIKAFFEFDATTKLQYIPLGSNL